MVAFINNKIFKVFHLFIFGSAWPLLCRLFSSCGEQALLSTFRAHYSVWGLPLLQSTGSSVCVWGGLQEMRFPGSREQAQ